MLSFAAIPAVFASGKTGPRPGHRHPPNRRKEESPDSIERRTGEEPGLVSAGTESATENDRPASVG